MLEKVERYIKREHIDVYDIAMISDEGAEERYYCPCNPCSENYSVTKIFISTAIGVLIDRGLVKPEDRLTDLLRGQIDFDYDPVWDRVTVLNCLQHRMGIDREVINIDDDELTAKAGCNWLKTAFDCPPVSEPGSVAKYTDTAHYLLSRVITAVTGKIADQFIYDELLKPMGFRQVSWARCPQGYTVGSSGSSMRASDVVKLGKLYLDRGVWDGKRLLSEQWVDYAEKNEICLKKEGHTSFLSKGGMIGQIVMYSRRLNIAVAWHSHSPDSFVCSLAPFIETVAQGITLIGHRGYSSKYVMNTEAAFLGAANHYSGGIETDIRSTKDGVLVCSHDATAKLADGTELTVADSTYEELTAQPLLNRFGNGDVYLCTFRRYLEICREYGLICFVEFKGRFSEELVVRSFELVKEVYRMDRVILQSFDLDNLKTAKRLYPELAIMMTYGCGEKDRIDLQTIVDLGFSMDMDVYIATPEAVKLFHDAGLEFAVWTCNDPDSFEYARSLGVDYVESDVY